MMDRYNDITQEGIAIADAKTIAILMQFFSKLFEPILTCQINLAF